MPIFRVEKDYEDMRRCVDCVDGAQVRIRALSRLVVQNPRQEWQLCIFSKSGCLCRLEFSTCKWMHRTSLLEETLIGPSSKLELPLPEDSCRMQDMLVVGHFHCSYCKYIKTNKRIWWFFMCWGPAVFIRGSYIMAVSATGPSGKISSLCPPLVWKELIWKSHYGFL